MTEPRTRTARPWKRSGAALDVAIALTFFTLVALSLVAFTPLIPLSDPEKVAPPLALTLGLGTAMTAPLAWRRRAPRTVLAIVLVAFSVFRLIEAPEGSISSFALFVAMYTVGAELPPERSRLPRVVVLVAIAGLVIYAWTVMIDPSEMRVAGRELMMIQLAEAGLNLLFGIAAWTLGDIAWRRRVAERELEAKVDELAANREALARRAVQDERVRIARELHDVVAHHVSVMGIQAGAARRSIARSPVEAEHALASVEQSSRDAVTEMQRLLQFLRSEDDPDNLTPQPSLAQLDALIDTVRETGLAVELEIQGTPRRLPDSVELSAFRIVQEALTNTLKHGEGVSCTRVRLTYEAERLRVEIHDDGTAAARRDTASAAGRGLVGMRERAALHGGDLTVEASPGGGFAVAGWLPTTAARGRREGAMP